MILESIHPDATIPIDTVYEERIVVLRANDEDEAKSKGEEIGRASKEEYQNKDGETVIWEFREVLDVLQLFDDPIKDGTEVYWSFLGEEELKRRLAYRLPE